VATLDEDGHPESDLSLDYHSNSNAQFQIRETRHNSMLYAVSNKVDSTSDKVE
jgi:hypothetical protein